MCTRDANGLISDCGRIIAEQKEKEGWFDIRLQLLVHPVSPIPKSAVYTVVFTMVSMRNRKVANEGLHSIGNVP
jgi:hypothetical protein